MLIDRIPPVFDVHSEFFWRSGADGQLRMLRCRDCDHISHPPGPRCTNCHSIDVHPAVLSGKARVTTFTVNHQQWVKGQPPYIVAKVELLDQRALWLITNLGGVDGDDVTLGMAVEAVFEAGPDGLWYPLFQPVQVAPAPAVR